MLRKLFKWLAALVVILAVGAVVFVWGVLGVAPIEGDVDHLWELVSNDVDFFVRWPGVTKPLEEPLATALSEKPGFEQIAIWKEEIADLSAEIAREVNPQIPGGLFEVDLKNDILAQEMAVAGAVRTNYAELKPDNLIFLMRIPGYLKFISALRRDFVRDKLPPEIRDRLEVVKGLYFKYTLPPDAARRLQQIRSGQARSDPNVIWFGRIKDVLLVSDMPLWIEAALMGGVETLPADTYFETEFIRNSVRTAGDDAEIFIRPNLAGMTMIQHGREEHGGTLVPVARLVPSTMTGDITVQATALANAISVRLSNNPPDQGFARVTKRHLAKLYEYEKGDLHLDLSEEGIGRFIPRERTVGAFLLHADAETLVDLILDYIPKGELQNLDEQARTSIRDKGQGFRDLRSLLIEITKDLDDTHMVVVHHPSVFDGQDYDTFEDRGDDWLDQAQLGYTLVSKVKGSAEADRARARVQANLRYLGLEPGSAEGGRGDLHPSGKFRLAEPMINNDAWSLVHPAYGAMVGGAKYFVFSSSVEAAEAVFGAAEDESERLVNDPAVQEVVGNLPREGTLALLLRGPGLHDALWDLVRSHARDKLAVPAFETDLVQKYEKAGMADEEIDRLVRQESTTYVDFKYPEIRERYQQQVALLDAVEIAGLGASLGVGPTKQVRAKAYFRFAVDEALDAGEE